MSGEFKIISEKFIKLTNNAPEALGLLDDVALVNFSESTDCGKVAISVDTISEGVHFFPDTPPRFIAKRLCGSSVSDLICKGITPKFAVLALSVGNSVVNIESWLDDFCFGFTESQNKYNFSLIGGDTISQNIITSCSLTVFGKEDVIEAKLRSSAQIGDYIYITNTLGDAFFSLSLLDNSHYMHEKISNIFNEYEKDSIINHYNNPSPPYELIDKIRLYANASIDISDGLISDIRHILRASSNKIGNFLSARIYIDKIPISKEVRKIKPLYPEYFIEGVISGGDDYQTMFTSAEIINDNNITMIGRINSSDNHNDIKVEVVDNTGSILNLSNNGYNHFSHI